MPIAAIPPDFAFLYNSAAHQDSKTIQAFNQVNQHSSSMAQMFPKNFFFFYVIFIFHRDALENDLPEWGVTGK